MQQNMKAIFGNGDLDEKSVNFLVAALEKNNLPGFDYLEFKLSLGKLRQLNMDEETAIKSAFATASTLGLTKETLLKTGKHYLEVLANEKKQFDAALKKQLEKRVTNKKAEVEKLQAQIGKWEEEIRKLQENIAKAKEIISQADSNIAAEMSKIETTRKNFEATHKSILSQVAQDLENIEKYL
ncbi:MAG: hypothetical protein Kow0027_12280 [Saprospiraceae bacterium]